MHLLLAVLVGVVTLLFRLNVDAEPNFSPVLAICLFSTFLFKDKSLALLVWMVPMLASDFILGWYPSAFFVYGSLAIITLIGAYIGNHKKNHLSNLVVKTFSASVLFFIFTNFGVWLLSGMYAKSLAGLGQCYLAAIPFFRNTLVSTFIFYSAFVCLFVLFQNVMSRKISANRFVNKI